MFGMSKSKNLVGDSISWGSSIIGTTLQLGSSSSGGTITVKCEKKEEKKEKVEYSSKRIFDFNESKVTIAAVVVYNFGLELYSVGFGMSVCCKQDIDNGLYNENIGILQAKGRALKQKNKHMVDNWNFYLKVGDKLNKQIVNSVLNTLVEDFKKNSKSYYVHG